MASIQSISGTSNGRSPGQQFSPVGKDLPPRIFGLVDPFDGGSICKLEYPSNVPLDLSNSSAINRVDTSRMAQGSLCIDMPIDVISYRVAHRRYIDSPRDIESSPLKKRKRKSESAEKMLQRMKECVQLLTCGNG